jgi:hypothetical protein
MAVKEALSFWQDQLLTQVVKVELDNKTAVPLINKQGTVRSRLLHSLAVDLLTWCQTRRIQLRAVYLPGWKNVLADKLSRPNQVLTTEWSLRESVVKWLFQTWGQPHLDLFASRENSKLPIYVSPVRDPQAYAVDALSLDWRGMYAYAFPPTAMMIRVAQKLQTTSQCQILLVAPYWPQRPWFPTIVKYAKGKPLKIPLTPNPLSQKLGNGKWVTHMNPEYLNLHAWLLCKGQS